MSTKKHTVTVPLGKLFVSEYGARGPAVLFVHSYCQYAAQWAPSCWELEQQARCFVMELRGHGSSTCEWEDIATLQHDLIAVVEQLGLDRPIVVAEQVSCATAALAVAERPDLFRGLVTINPPAELGDWEGLSASLEAAQGMLEQPGFVERTGIGATGSTPEQLEEYLDARSQSVKDDWLYSGIREQYAEILRTAITVYEDGSWARRPLLKDILREMDTFSQLVSSGHFQLHLPTDFPIWQVESTFEEPGEEPHQPKIEPDFSKKRKFYLPARLHPECSHPQEIADIIMSMHQSLQDREKQRRENASA